MNKPEALVTGAHGFVGRYTARCLARHGYMVRSIGHGRCADGDCAEWGLAECFEADVNMDSLQRFAGTPSLIVHCAGGGSVPFSFTNPREDFQRTVAGTTDVLEYVRRHSPATRVVYPSSAGVYGVALTCPIAEEAAMLPVSPYGNHKRMAEEMVSSYSRYFGLSASIVRLFSIYGPGLRKQLLWDACAKLTSSEPVFKGTGDEVRDWLYAEDAAELLVLAGDKADSTCPVVNAGSGVGASVRAILSQTALSLGVPETQIRFSGIPGTGDPDRFIADITKARQWGWTPRKDWRDGIAQYTEWWLRAGRRL